MMRGVARMLAPVRRFARDKRGAAVVEFALILPVLLLLYMGSIEASSLITVDRRINVISGTVGDLVARTNGSIEAATLTDYFRAAEAIIFPYGDADLRQAVSLVTVTPDGVATVVWSCGYNGGTPRLANSPYALPANMNLIARPPSGSGFVVASETWYDYLPVLGIVFTEALNLYQDSYYLPRQEKEIPGPASC